MKENNNGETQDNTTRKTGHTYAVLACLVFRACGGSKSEDEITG
tara:strand:+ start:189 stop:320 length:132 start_codon:yes stop_codon:yes gene_type:complete